MSPILSLIVPVYNVAPYLCECLDSVLRQSVSDWECICIDDGSTDGSSEILDEYAKLDSRIRVIHKANEGVSVARNVGLRIARGDWIACLDGDDKVLPYWLNALIDMAQRHQADLVRCEMKFWYGDQLSSEIQPNERQCSKEKVITGSDKVLQWGWRSFIEIGCGTCALIFRRVLVAGGFPVGMRMKEDRIFNVQLLPKCSTVVDMGFAGYLYRRHRDSACHVPRRSADCVRFVEEIVALYESQLDVLGRVGILRAIEKVKDRAIWDDFIEWLEFSTWSDRLRSGKLMTLMRKQDLRNVGDVRLRWRLAKWFFDRTGYVFPLFAVEMFFTLYRMVVVPPRDK